jgi:phage terminase small subunit
MSKTRSNLTQKQENFCLNYFKLGNATEAGKLAKYSPNGVRATTSKLLTNHNVRQRLQELRDKAASDKIMDVVERKEKLSEIAREVIKSHRGTVIRQGNIGAISELNKMDHIYETGINLNFNDVKFVVGKGYQEKLSAEEKPLSLNPG